MLIQRCMHIISQSNAGHDILDINHANLIFNVVKYKDSIIMYYSMGMIYFNTFWPLNSIFDSIECFYWN